MLFAAVLSILRFFSIQAFLQHVTGELYMNLCYEEGASSTKMPKTSTDMLPFAPSAPKIGASRARKENIVMSMLRLANAA